MSTPYRSSLLPAGTVLQNPSDTGPWLYLPPGCGTAFIHVEDGTSNGAGVAAACIDLSNNPNGGCPVLNAWTSTALTGPGTGDGFQLVGAPLAVRLRLASTHPAGVVITGTINSNG